MKTNESMENYLETILILEQKNNYVRAIDIATELGFSKPSISNAIKKLRAAGYVTIEEKNPYPPDRYGTRNRGCHL